MRSIAAVVAFTAGVASAAGAQGGGAQQNRPVLEQQIRERMAAITRERLNLDDAQMAKLKAVNERVAPQMTALMAQERQTRQQLRAQLTSAAPDQSQVATFLDTVLRLQKQRIALLESEQKDLSGFLTPVQRARYMALQTQIRRRVEELRGGNARGPRRRAENPPLR